jgi:hypothetical protein
MFPIKQTLLLLQNTPPSREINGHKKESPPVHKKNLDKFWGKKTLVLTNDVFGHRVWLWWDTVSLVLRVIELGIKMPSSSPDRPVS